MYGRHPDIDEIKNVVPRKGSIEINTDNWPDDRRRAGSYTQDPMKPNFKWAFWCNIFTDNDNYTEIRIMSAGTDSRIIGKSVSEIELPNNSKVIAIISSSGNISHNFSNTINSLDKIIFQVPINK